ncbi:MAG: hypothetical protein ACO3D0_02440 [Ilumatobacteraceae bacterium]
MREIFSVRFFAAVGAVAGLFVVLIAVQSSRNGIDSGSSEPVAAVRRIDLVEPVESSTNPAFTVVDGVASTETELVLDERRRVRVVPGTPGVISCDPAGRDRCAIVADLLGEAVVWFALVPAGRGPAVELPAIDTIDDGIATLVNGWQVPHAPVLDRRCRDAGGRDVEFASYREFRERLDDRFVSFYDTTDRRLVAVECL